MLEYVGPVADDEFVLFDLLDAESEWARLAAFEGLDRDTARAVLAECAKLAAGTMAPPSMVTPDARRGRSLSVTSDIPLASWPFPLGNHDARAGLTSDRSGG